jgi:hypothetical protein
LEIIPKKPPRRAEMREHAGVEMPKTYRLYDKMLWPLMLGRHSEPPGLSIPLGRLAQAIGQAGRGGPTHLRAGLGG